MVMMRSSYLFRLLGKLLIALETIPEKALSFLLFAAQKLRSLKLNSYLISIGEYGNRKGKCF